MQLPDGTWTTVNRTTFAGWYTNNICDAILDAYEKEFHSLDHAVLVTDGPNTMSKVHKCPFCTKWFASEKGMWRSHVPTNNPREFAEHQGNKRAKVEEVESGPDGDYWESIKGAYVRHHIVPREQLFVPEKDSAPFPLTHVSNDRLTSAVFEHGADRQFTDNWKSGDSNRSLDAKWTGTTTFYPDFGVGGRKNERKSDQSLEDGELQLSKLYFQVDAADKAADSRADKRSKPLPSSSSTSIFTDP